MYNVTLFYRKKLVEHDHSLEELALLPNGTVNENFDAIDKGKYHLR